MQDSGWDGCKKPSYVRSSHVTACRPDQDISKSGLTCYDKCPKEAKGIGPFCFGKCPAGLKSCYGILCLTPEHNCAELFTAIKPRVQQIIDTAMGTDWGKGVLDFGKLVGDETHRGCPSW